MELIELYSRLMILREVGVAGLKKLMDSRVVIIGCGATGTAIAELLVRTGVGKLRVVDRDFVELSNITRSHLHTYEDGKTRVPKAVSCVNKLRKINPFSNVEYSVTEFNSRTAEEVVRGFDIIVDATDNFQTRYLINEVAVKWGIPWIYVGVEAWYGSVALFEPGKTACFKCLIPKAPPEDVNACDVRGVMGSVVSVVSGIAATEVIKYLLGLGRPGYLIVYDGMVNKLVEIKLTRREDCPVCVYKKFKILGKEPEKVKVICGTKAVEVFPEKEGDFDLTKLKELGSRNFKLLSFSDFSVTFEVQGFKVTVFRDGRAIVDGTTDKKLAEGVYRKLISVLESS